MQHDTEKGAACDEFKGRSTATARRFASWHQVSSDSGSSMICQAVLVKPRHQSERESIASDSREP